MNRLTIIGNLTRDPELRALQDGTPVCVFTVAVNRRKKNAGGENEADYFRVTAWRELGDLCARYLAKGRKVCVIGAVSVRAYISQQTGQPGASLEVTAQEVEFLTPRGEESEGRAPAGSVPAVPVRPAGTPVEVDDLPF